MSFSKLFIIKKLDYITGYLEELKDLLNFSNEEIKTNSGRMHTGERLFQLIADTALDVNHHLIRELNLKVTDDLQNTFHIIAEAENGILPQDFANKIAPSVKFRNLIVHVYEKLDKDLFLKYLREGNEDFKKYVNYISEYLDKSEELDKD